MNLTSKQKKYIKKHLKNQSLSEIALSLAIFPKEIEEYLVKRWGKEKFKKFYQNKQTPTASQKNIPQDKVNPSYFNLKTWLKNNYLNLLLLLGLVFIAYVNSLGNEFLSDDIGLILENKQLDSFSYVTSQMPMFLRPLLVFLINSFFGKIPIYYRLLNFLAHLATVGGVYLLVSLAVSTQVALLSAILLAVHPLQSEAVVWISGGHYVLYSFFLVFSLAMFVLARQQKKYYFISLISFLLALLSSEKAVVYPIILFTFIISFQSLRKRWPKIIVPLIMAGLLATFYIVRIPERISSLQTDYYQTPQTINPLFQIPVAVSSYLELIVWPKNLTLYHSEMQFSWLEYCIRLIVTLGFFGLIIYSYKKNRQIFFWLSFFIIALLPTLTPLGISWIVAERYVYLSSIGIYVALAFLVSKLLKKQSYYKPTIVIFIMIVILLTVRTIVRNIDWKNQDNLWLAAAKTSPSSAQNHNNLGDLYGRRGDLDRAAEEFKAAIKLLPNYADAYHNLGNVYSRIGKMEEAITSYKKALEFNPRLWQTYENLGAIYFNQQDFSKAEEYLKGAIKVNPQNPSLYVNLGIIYLNQEKKQAGIEEIQKALQLDPNNEKIKSLLLQVSNQ